MIYAVFLGRLDNPAIWLDAACDALALLLIEGLQALIAGVILLPHAHLSVFNIE